MLTININMTLAHALTVSAFLLVPAAINAATSSELRTGALKVLAPIPDKMPGAENDTPARVKLGRDLFFEKKLSANNTQSCNSCHAVDQNRGGVDNEPTSPGAFGKRVAEILRQCSTRASISPSSGMVAPRP